MEERREGPARDLSDMELAVGMRAGDANAFGQLYDRHVRGIHDFLARCTGAAAEDLVRATFLRVCEGRSALRDPTKVRAWLYAAAHDLALSRPSHARRDGPPAPEQDDDAELVWAAAARLEARQYALLDLSARRGLSTREIAAVLGVRTSQAAVLVRRAREALDGAVLTLLVARRRERCERLAALVPEGTHVLTGPRRSALDHHIRRCAACQELARRLVAPAELLGALPPLPLPAALGGEGRQRLLAALRTEPGPPGPPRRRTVTGRRRWAGALALTIFVLLLGAGGTAAYLVRPAPTAAGERAPSPSSGQVTDVTPTPAATPTPSPTPQPVVVTPTPRPTPTPTPPPLVVRTVTLSWDRQSCPRNPQGFFVCSFTATATVANPNGKDAVAGTLTITPITGQPSTVSTSIAPQAGQNLVIFKFQIPFRTSPCGTAVAATTAPNAVSSHRVGFGSC